MIVVPLAIAVSLEHKHVKLKGLFQAILYIPGLISISAAVLIWAFNFQQAVRGCEQPFWF